MALGETWSYGNPYEWMERLRRGFDPVIITCAVNGGIQGKESNPTIPETPEEIAAQAGEAYDAGASIIHVHGRKPDDPTFCTEDPDVYREINALIRERCPEVIVNNTTGGDTVMSMEGRYRCLEAAPEMASLNMGPDMSRFKIPARPPPLLHPHDELVLDNCIPFTYGIIERLARMMLELDVKPEMELYNSGQFWATRDVIAQGLARPPYVHQFVMGAHTGIYPTPDNLWSMVEHLPEDSVWFVCGIGVFQLPMITIGLVLGGNVRVGLEDNIYYRRGEKAAGNGRLVERAVRLARELNREVATPAQAREILGLSPEPRRFERPRAATTA